MSRPSTRLRRFNAWFLIGVVAVGGILLSGCSRQSDAANCSKSTTIASVGSARISTARYNELLRYTLDFFESGDSASLYFHRNICGRIRWQEQCAMIKRRLLSRMIDQAVIVNYADKKNLIPDGYDWTSALKREDSLVQNAGGHVAFLAYLAKVGINQADFRWLESQQIQTAKVMKSVGARRFPAWLTQQTRNSTIKKCPGVL